MPNSGKIKVMVVDDHPLLREGIVAVLANEGTIELVAEAENGHEAITKFRAFRPDITLMDLRLPDISGIDAIKAIRSEFPTSRFIVLTTYLGDIQALRALQAGATGYMLKTMLRTEMIDTIRAVNAGRRHIPPEIARELAEHVADDRLTEREIEILHCVAAGTSNKIIADRLHLSEATVKGHMKNILSKLGANDRTHAVTIAMKRGFLDT
jgi:DNA-binding NarL/FixJ family response regulator